MFAVRYAALVALSLWLGDLLLLAGFAGPVPGDLVWPAHLGAYILGAVVLISLFALKFLGPPPRAFTARAGIVVLMLCLVAVGDQLRGASTSLALLNVALALMLLSWYAHE